MQTSCGFRTVACNDFSKIFAVQRATHYTTHRLKIVGRAVTCDDVDVGLVIGQLPVMMLMRDWL